MQINLHSSKYSSVKWKFPERKTTLKSHLNCVLFLFNFRKKANIDLIWKKLSNAWVPLFRGKQIKFRYYQNPMKRADCAMCNVITSCKLFIFLLSNVEKNLFVSEKLILNQYYETKERLWNLKKLRILYLFFMWLLNLFQILRF